MLTVTAPDPINGGALVGELRAAGLAVTDVVLNRPDLEVHGPGEPDRATVEQVAADHVPPVRPPDPDAELDAALAAVDTSGVSDAATREALDAVIAALRGRSGRAGAAAGRRPT